MEKKRGQSPFLYFDYSGTEKNERRKKGDSPLFYILIILALKKVKDGKKGTVPFFLPAG